VNFFWNTVYNCHRDSHC